MMNEIQDLTRIATAGMPRLGEEADGVTDPSPRRGPAAAALAATDASTEDESAIAMAPAESCRPDPPAPGGRRPQTVRIEHHGLILEFCDGVAADPVLGRAAADGPATGQARLHCRIRSDGLLTHAVLQVARAAIGRFVQDLDAVIQTRRGDASLAGGPAYPSAMRIEADDGRARLTLLACPALAARVRIVIEALELDGNDLAAIRGWVADHR